MKGTFLKIVLQPKTIIWSSILWILKKASNYFYKIDFLIDRFYRLHSWDYLEYGGL